MYVDFRKKFDRVEHNIFVEIVGLHVKLLHRIEYVPVNRACHVVVKLIESIPQRLLAVFIGGGVDVYRQMQW